MILTPDSDVYAEDLGPGSVDVVQTRDRPSDRSIPYGIDQAQVYDFATPPTPEQLTGLVAKGRQEAARERVRLGAVPSGLQGPANAQPAAPPRVQLPIQGGGAALQPVAGGGAPPGKNSKKVLAGTVLVSPLLGNQTCLNIPLTFLSSSTSLYNRFCIMEFLY